MNENRTVNTREITFAGLFIALGVIVPYLTGHAFGIQGVVFLPMHIPVLMAGLLLGWRYGLLVGFITPIISSLLTAMPAPGPILWRVGSELVVFGLLTGLLRKKLKLPLYVSLIGAMVLGRVAGAVAVALTIAPPSFAALVGITIGHITTGLPGIAIQLAFIPVLVKLIENAYGQVGVIKEVEVTEDNASSANNNIASDNVVKDSAEAKNYLTANQEAISRAIKAIEAGECGCAVIKNNVIIHKGIGRGVSPLLELAESADGLKKMENAIVIDRIIGKAAAMLLVYGKAKFAYGLTMSKSAKEYLHAYGIETKNNRCVDAISDRTGRGICPMERSVMEIDDASVGLKKIQETLASLRSKIS